MSRKDYVQFAAIIQDNINRAKTPEAREAVKSVARDMADYFRDDNSNFDRNRFYQAAGITVAA